MNTNMFRIKNSRVQLIVVSLDDYGFSSFHQEIILMRTLLCFKIQVTNMFEIRENAK